MAKPLLVAIAGSPNSGKTTLFNALTGARQHVANYPGVTVERVEGSRRVGEAALRIVDLPGTYSLSACSEEERVARAFLLGERPDVVVGVADATALDRNLYLVTQLMELGRPVVIALTMTDLARSRGLAVDAARLGRLLGVPVVATVATRGDGVDALARELVEVAQDPSRSRPAAIPYGEDLETELARVEARLRVAAAAGDPGAPPPRWTALKLLEGDAEVAAGVADAEARQLAGRARARLKALHRDEAEVLAADRRHGFIAGACQEVVDRSAETRRTASDRIDAVLAHRTLGLPLFLGLMYLVFQLVFTLGNPLMELLDRALGALAAAATAHWPAGAPAALRSLLVEGVLGGVGNVVVFLPSIALLYLAIALLEDSGYMARAAFVMDHLMHRLGLHGKSFIPMLLGFGCSVPAILATRTLEDRRDRLTTILVLPLMSCGARLTIYALLIPAFFPPAWRGTVLAALYAAGIVLAVLAARLLRRTLLRGETMPLVLDLPPYRLPTLRSVGFHMGRHAGQYLRKAGTLILAFSVVLWALATWPRSPPRAVGTGRPAAGGAASERAEQLAGSWAGRIGRGLEPVLRPAGFDGRLGTAMLGAFAAKELFVAQLGIVFAVDAAEGDPAALRARLRAAYSPLRGLCVMLFCLIGLPCMATVAATRKETGSWGWSAFQFAALTVLGWLVAVAVFQAGRLLGLD